MNNEQWKDEADNGIIKAIASITPWHGKEVKAVFNRCKSYDLTLRVCKNASRLNVRPVEALYHFKSEHTEAMRAKDAEIERLKREHRTYAEMVQLVSDDLKRNLSVLEEDNKRLREEAMDDMREALEALQKAVSGHLGFLYAHNVQTNSLIGALTLSHEALAAPKWTFTDEGTPGEAAVWWLLGDYWNLATWEERRNMNRSYVVDNVEPRPCVLARTGEGPPTPEETRQIMERADAR